MYIGLQLHTRVDAVTFTPNRRNQCIKLPTRAYVVV